MSAAAVVVAVVIFAAMSAFAKKPGQIKIRRAGMQEEVLFVLLFLLAVVVCAVGGSLNFRKLYGSG